MPDDMIVKSRRCPTLKLLLVAGARPNFMKIAPIIDAIVSYNRHRSPKKHIAYCLVHTGQHYDVNMSKVFFKELGIPSPHVNLEVGSGTHAAQTARIMLEFEPVCLREDPDWVIVVGDVNSTVACTLVASKLRIRVAHVEAGLRSFDRTMPEEINRVVTDSLADLLLTPSFDANENLIREGIPQAKIHLVGNIMIDSLIKNIKKAGHSQLRSQLGLQIKKFAYVTLHRPSNVDDPKALRSIMHDLYGLAGRIPVVFPVHPRTRKMFAQHGVMAKRNKNLKLIDPAGYLDSIWLTRNAFLVLTDSGGLQEESTYFHTPCLTLRPNTERPVTITVGTNKLTSHKTLASDIDAILKGGCPTGRIPELWDGHTADRILKLILATE